MRTDCPRSPAPIERQLALPLERAAGPPVLGELGPGLAPRRVWQGLAPATQATVRQAVARICREVVHDASQCR